MTKIRINELARELEVKPHRILDLLPELGVTEKKTHSSSIDDDVAIKVRRYFGFDDKGPGPRSTGTAVEDEPESHEEGSFEDADRPSPRAEAPIAAEAARVMEEAPAAPTAAPEPRFVPRAASPIRPPLAGPMTSAPPAMPQPPKPAPPRESSPALSPTPTMPPPAAVPGSPPRTIAVPAKPLPPPRPGQILTGPRQPLPPAEPPQRPAAPPPPPPAQGASPAPGTLLPGRPKPPAPPMQSTPGAPAPGRPVIPQPRPPAPPPQHPVKPAVLAGQPAARPVVPPRPDLVARLQHTQPKASPGQPISRPPMPGKPPAPGQPPSSYRGPVRPGQPILRPGTQPGGPGGRPLGRPGARPMHPTSPVRPGEAPPPVPATGDQARRDAAKRQRERHREVEVVEKDLRLSRRNEPEQILAPNREITISEGVTVKELSEKLGIKANLIIKRLVDRKIFATINQPLDMKLAEDLARDFGATSTQMTYEEETTFDLEMAEDSAQMDLRPPVVTIMGHVDHGKTSLLDAIRETNVAGGEFGGITQHIGAYYVEKNGRKIVFIDTPGHAAFTRMRARGGKVSDIVILVVAADDGVMPQTREAIDHARAAKVPIIVALNKIDKPDAHPERIKQQLTELGLMPEDWGGETVTVPLSAKTKQNIDLLLEMILLVSEMQNLRANAKRPAVGTVLEAQLDRGRGPVATVLVQKGTLRVGDFFICGSVFSRVRALFDDRGNPLKEAGPSMPVEVLGLDDVPEVGDTFQVVTDTAKAKQIVGYRETRDREEQMKKGARVTLETLALSFKEGEIKELNIILKADVGGTCEVLSDTLQKLSTDKVKVRVLHTGVGAINESDVLLASASNGIIVGFNVRPEKSATSLAEREGVDIRMHTIIYELTDEMKKAMAGLLEPVIKEIFKGRANVRDTFRITKVGTVAGCLVTDGSIPRDAFIRLLRDNIVIFTGRVGSLKRFKDDVSEVKTGFECGIGIAGYNDVKPGDVMEAFTTEKTAAEI